MTAWQSGWWQGATHRPSPFFNERPIAGDISWVVIHGISLPHRVYGGPAVDQLFLGVLNTDQPPFESLKGLEVSAHFFIRRCGAVIQYVSCDARAWHAGRSSWAGRDQVNDFSIGIELEGCDEEPYELKQYDVLKTVLTAIYAQYPETRDHLVGHSDIAPGRKTDPGPFFDWHRVSHIPLGER